MHLAIVQKRSIGLGSRQVEEVEVEEPPSRKLPNSLW